MPNAVPTVSRRQLLVGTAALALLGGAVSGCGTASTPDPALDVLTGQLARARADSMQAAAAATGAPPPLASALNAVASIRDAHAQALSDEIARLGGARTDATPTTSRPAGPPPAPQQVLTALQQSGTAAGQAAAGQSGYRAGLLASIAAACTAAATVNLAGVTA